jgi:hypothetical protein
MRLRSWRLLIFPAHARNRILLPVRLESRHVNGAQNTPTVAATSMFHAALVNPKAVERALQTPKTRSTKQINT